jgi:hypothetical protein
VTDQLDRYSMVTTRSMLDTPNFRLFMVATAQGRMMRADRTFSKLDRSPEGRPVGVEISIKKRRAILELVGVTDATWRQAIGLWTEGRLAHRCKRGIDFLFLEPLRGEAAACPRCTVSLSHSEPLANLTHGVSQSHTSSTPIAASSSAIASSRGGCTGDEEGDEDGLPPFISPEEAKNLIEGRSQKARSHLDEEALGNIHWVFGTGRPA